MHLHHEGWSGKKSSIINIVIPAEAGTQDGRGILRPWDTCWTRIRTFYRFIRKDEGAKGSFPYSWLGFTTKSILVGQLEPKVDAASSRVSVGSSEDRGTRQDAASTFCAFII